MLANERVKKYGLQGGARSIDLERVRQAVQRAPIAEFIESTPEGYAAMVGERDLRHSLADISKAATLLGYQPTHHIDKGLKVAMEWYVHHLTKQAIRH